ncbi:S41 family peptidase [Zhouia amylolytica]|uniref:Tricorn protease homolog n=1 Tax=Zhouia amylolytica AD3 TaxID=1286632 RepID=W2UKV5_9FLAO|nr:S41 family peptidase [Zhouia amylolytica]ETN94638.1 putative exported tricorn protease [Zhouia amylolytica AD3]
MKNFSSFLVLGLLLIGVTAQSQNVNDTRLLNSPAISNDQIAFVYAEDLWIADKDGSNPKRLTIDEGRESNPVFSPDGSMIAFSAEYDGNTDVFVIPSTGGVPKRLTWHPSWDIVRGFTPDGAVLFNSRRTNYTNRHAKLYTVSVDGGQPKELPIPTVFRGTISGNGNYIAYNPNYEAFSQWKHYRGGTQARIWVYNRSNKRVSEIPKPASGSNDAHPQWIGNKVYFRSDRNGEFNLFSYDINTKEVDQHTNYTDFPVIGMGSNGKELIYEQGGYLHIFNPESNSSEKITVGIATDLLEMRPRFVSGANYIRSAGISPSGVRAIFDFRGDIVTVPADKGDVNYITQTPGVHEKEPQWSPDGKNIAYFSDVSGEYAIHLKDIQSDKLTSITLDGTGFYAYLNWSPDSKKLTFVDNGRNLYVLDVSSKRIKKIATDTLYIPGAFRDMFGSWSYDSNFITYTVITETNFEQAFIYSLKNSKSYPISDGLSNVSEPIFDPGGKYVYMLASTDAGPVVNWFDQSNQDMEMTNSIYLVTLREDIISPLAKENDVEVLDEDASDSKKDKKDKLLEIDFDGLQHRIIDLPVQPGMYSGLACPEEGNLYYMNFLPHSGYSSPQPLMHFDLKKREAKEVLKANQFVISADGKKTLIRSGSSWNVADTGKKPDNGGVKVDMIKIKIDPVKEWKNIFDEAWRVNRDYFYDPGMHGADWDAMKAKYIEFLPDVVCRSDLYRVMQWMFSELAVGHHRFQGTGDRLNNPETVNVGLLGADYEIVNNRYRFKKIYGGLNWTPDLRSPLTEPGVNVKEREYLIAVDGVEVTADDNLFSYFENKAGKITYLKIGSNSNGSNAREVKVVPIGNEDALRNRAWVEENIEKVNKATDGQVAYVYVPNTAGAGHEYFKRYFFPQVNKKAIIVDERYNGGGQLADYYIDILRKPYQSHWNFRYGKDLKAPNASIQGPKVMLIDETAGSGGDYLPWMFRKYELGTLIGKRTWGGLVGILGYPEFIDGGSVTAPNVAFYSEKGFRVENEGVAPDIDVEQWPKEVIEGRDPQLEKAIEVVLEKLKEYQPNYPSRPAYPNRVKGPDRD